MISRDRSLFSLLYFREMAYKIALLPYYMCTFTELTNYCLDGQLLQKDGCFITQSTIINWCLIENDLDVYLRL